MSYKKVFILSLILLLASTLFSQQRCGVDITLQNEIKASPEYAKELIESKKLWSQMRSQRAGRRMPVTIPVHFIIVHYTDEEIGDPSNPTMEQILAQIEVLNTDFAGLNIENASTPPVFTRGSTEISFCLASEDPDGNPSNGVTRYPSNESFDNFDTKSDIMRETIWDRNLYLNIYVTSEFEFLGEARIPSLISKPSPFWLDAVIVRNDAFGGPGFPAAPQFNLGRTATHEVGHWLGLSHMWGGDSDDCFEDDGISDTPQQFKPNFNCPSHPSPSCQNNGDMFMCFMDYVDDNCMMTFSQEQTDLMQTIIENVRFELLQGPDTKCTASLDPLSLNLVNTTSVTCSNGSDATAQISIEGGTPPYTLSLNDSSIPTTSTIMNLPAGDFRLSAMDVLDSVSTVEFSIVGPPSLLMNVVIGNQPCDSDNSGMIFIAATGGNSNTYQYVLNDGEYVSEEGLFSELPLGFYSASVIDNLGCTVSDTFSLINSTPVISDIFVTPPTCGSIDEGTTVEIQVENNNGAILNYTLGSEVNQTGIFEDVEVGSYSILVSDQQSCSIDTNLTIEALENIQINFSSTDILCFGDNTGSISYNVENTNNEYTSFLNGSMIQDTIIEGLPPGLYNLEVVDTEGCRGLITITISEPAEISVEVNISESNSADCAATTAVDVIATGGSGEFIYSIGLQNNNTGLFDNLPGGDYNVIVSDANECEADAFFTIESSGELEIAILEQSNPSCFNSFDGSFYFDIINGSGAYEITLNDQVLESTLIENLSSGSYSLVITDETGCSANIDFVLDSPEPIQIVNFISNNSACSALGTVSIEAIGGSGELTYALEGEENNSGSFSNLEAGDYVLEISDQNGCFANSGFTIEEEPSIAIDSLLIFAPLCANSNDGRITFTIENSIGYFSLILNGAEIPSAETIDSLSAGDYELFIQDQTGCVDSSFFTILGPEPIVVTNIQTTPNSCNNIGSANINAVGGIGILSYTVNDITNTTGEFSGLQGGDYTVNISDNNLCSRTMDFTIHDFTDIVIEVGEAVTPTCDVLTNGAISFSVFGGLPPYDYFLNESTIDTEIINGLSSGEYLITVIDSNECVSNASFFIPSPIGIEMEIDVLSAPGCDITNPGAIQIIGMGGTEPYTYSFGTENNNSGLFPINGSDEYIITIIDNNGCVIDSTLFIQGPNQLQVDIANVNQLDCSDSNDASFTINVSEGNPPYQYYINELFFDSPEISNLGPGEYDIEVIDDAGCNSNLTVTIFDAYEVQLELIQIFPAECTDGGTGFMQLEATAGEGPYTYTITAEGTGQEFTETNQTGFFDNLLSGWYSSSVIDVNNCETEEDLFLGNSLSFQTQLYPTDETCAGLEDGMLRIEILGDSGPYNIQINGQNTTDLEFSNLPAGQYDILVTDDFGCERLSTVTLETGSQIEATIEIILEPGCNENQEGIVMATASGGLTPYTFILEEQQNNNGSFLNLQSGDYVLEIIDGNGCSITQNFELNGTETLEILLLETQSVSCPDGFDGFVSFDFESSSEIKYAYFEGPNGLVLSDTIDGGLDTLNIDSLDLSYDMLPPGTYFIELTNEENCTSSLQFEIEEPAPIIITTDDVEYDNETGLGSIAVVAAGGTGSLLYTLNDETNNHGLFTNLELGPYTIIVTDQNGCSATFDYEVTTTTSISTKEDLSFKVFPNPSVSEIFIESNNPVEEIRIYNNQYKLIRSQKIRLESQALSTIDVSDLHEGLYFIWIRSGDTTEMAKIIKLSAEE